MELETELPGHIDTNELREKSFYKMSDNLRKFISLNRLILSDKLAEQTGSFTSIEEKIYIYEQIEKILNARDEVMPPRYLESAKYDLKLQNKL